MVAFKRLAFSISATSLLALGACAGGPDLQPAGFMSLGQNTNAPRGFMELCRRDPRTCSAGATVPTAETLAAMQVATERAYWLTRVRAVETPSEPNLRIAIVAGAAAQPLRTADAAASVQTMPHELVVGRAKRPAPPAKVSPRKPAKAKAAPPSPTPLYPAVATIESPSAVETADRTRSTQYLRPSASLTQQQWADISRINRQVNSAIAMRTDLAGFGMDDLWQAPGETAARYGDCEDYVLQKRHELIAAGFSADDLSIALVNTPSGEPHAVLLIADVAGEYVLDNRSTWILPWSATRYQWVERQMPGRPLDWVRIG